ncbi:hypothetical protein BKA70DRAFT_99153 [Coprinopsis sp. MPI-PUGE-AT-0042]|nr:hypothetical protein BKA70DRAFT_99153 [Coprinopsis sp. MPI-PUGE-AT-0042]
MLKLSPVVPFGAAQGISYSYGASSRSCNEQQHGCEPSWTTSLPSCLIKAAHTAFRIQLRCCPFGEKNDRTTPKIKHLHGPWPVHPPRPILRCAARMALGRRALFVSNITTDSSCQAFCETQESLCRGCSAEIVIKDGEQPVTLVETRPRCCWLAAKRSRPGVEEGAKEKKGIQESTGQEKRAEESFETEAYLPAQKRLHQHLMTSRSTTSPKQGQGRSPCIPQPLSYPLR